LEQPENNSPIEEPHVWKEGVKRTQEQGRLLIKASDMELQRRERAVYHKDLLQATQTMIDKLQTFKNKLMKNSFIIDPQSITQSITKFSEVCFFFFCKILFLFLFFKHFF
jgi:hypothetical protein